MNRRTTSFIILTLTLLLPEMTQANESLTQPRYSFALTLGQIKPDTPNWSTHYSDSTPREVTLALGWKPLSFLETGIEAGHFSARGTGYLMLNARPGGQVVHEVAPLHVYAVIRGKFYFDQWLVPYLGANVGQVFYQQSVAESGSSRGSASSHGLKAGLQLSLDHVDPGATRTLRQEYGIEHVYVAIEHADNTAKAMDVNGESIELLGRSLRFGLLFEF